MLQEQFTNFTLVNITHIKQVDGVQQDAEYFCGVDNPGLYKRLKNTSLSGNLKKKTVQVFDIGDTTESQLLLVSKWMNFFFL